MKSKCKIHYLIVIIIVLLFLLLIVAHSNKFTYYITGANERERLRRESYECPGRLVCKISGYSYTHTPDLYDPEGNLMLPVNVENNPEKQEATLTYCGVLNKQGNNVLVVTSEDVQPYLHWLHEHGVDRRLSVSRLGKSAEGKYIWLTS